MSIQIIDTTVTTNQEEVTEKLYEFIERPELFAYGRGFECYADENGYNKGLPVNFEAMDLLESFGISQRLVGPAVFIIDAPLNGKRQRTH